MGFSIAALNNRHSFFKTTKRWGTISDLAVRPNDRSKGIGNALLAHTLGWFRDNGVPVVEVSVLAGNQAGADFWESMVSNPFPSVYIVLSGFLKNAPALSLRRQPLLHQFPGPVAALVLDKRQDYLFEFLDHLGVQSQLEKPRPDPRRRTHVPRSLAENREQFLDLPDDRVAGGRQKANQDIDLRRRR